MSSRKRIPVNIIGGSLGVGKTTMINHVLEQRPSNEKWAVLVNEYGLVGLDAALMQKTSKWGSGSGVEIKEVAGGCICCSAGFMFKVSLVLLLQRRPARLLIEPTGLAALSGILDTLDQPGIREAVDVQSVICLIDPTQLEQSLLRTEIQDQVEAADILLANRSDLANDQQLEAFQKWATSLFPKKRFVDKIQNGRIPIDYLNLVTERENVISRGGHKHGTDHHNIKHNESDNPIPSHQKDLSCDESQSILQLVHHSQTTSTIGWICWDQIIFDAEHISCWLSEISQQSHVRRIKAVVRTNEGWWGFNFVNGIKDIHPNGYRRDSRLEILIEGDQVTDTETLEKQLRNCIASNLALAAK